MIEWKSDVLSIHITEECNLRCKYCYINNGKRNKQVISKEDIDETLKYIKNINTIFIYGGEPLLHLDIVKYIIDTYTDKTIIIATNGTLLTEDLMQYFIDNSVGVMISLDNWSYIKNTHRGMSAEQYMNVIDNIIKFNEYDKLGLFLTVSHTIVDLDDYFKFVNKFKIQHVEAEIAVYRPIVGEEFTENWLYKNKHYIPYIIKSLFQYRDNPPNKLRKLRLLPNGAITRNHVDFPDEYIDFASNLKNTNIYENEKFYIQTKFPKICESCQVKKYCPNYNIFPNILNDIGEENIHNTFACKLAKMYYKEIINRE